MSKDFVDYKDNEFLWNSFIRLGEMIGDGLGDEPDEKWIKQQYRQTARALGILKTERKRKNGDKIDEFMSKRLEEVKCDCGGDLKQSRKGSFIGICKKCGKKYRLGHRKK